MPSPTTPIVPAREYDSLSTVSSSSELGIMASLCGATYSLSVCQIDDRPEPTTAGRADGLQPRTLEVMRNIGGVKPKGGRPGAVPVAGLAKRIISEGVRVYEVAFWDPTPTEALARTSRAPSCPEFIDVVDNYTLLLHQGLIENAFLDETEARRTHLPADKAIPAPPGGVFRPYQFLTANTDLARGDYPVEAKMLNVETGETVVVYSKYLMGCDGARSGVRKAIAGGGEKDGNTTGLITMVGEMSDIIWGVVDVEVKTDFPDILSKCMVHSKDAGSIMIIPREDGLCRFYVQLKAPEDGGASHIERSKATLEYCYSTAKAIFQPFTVEFAETPAWYSIYQIGQRIASRYALDDRIFLGGDATHTHSPKAGQGMNISLLDAYSLVWKINLVEKGMADASVLLPTYESERKGIAEALLKFDAEYSRLFSGRNPVTTELEAAVTTKSNGVGAVDAQRFIETFKRHAFFTSGCGAVYTGNILNAMDDSDLVKNYPIKGVFNPAGTKQVVGQRLLPGKLTRAVDANQVRIQQEVKMNGMFRIHVLAGGWETSRETLKAFDAYLSSPASFLNVHRPAAGVTASILDGKGPNEGRHIEAEVGETRNPFFTFLTVFSDPHTTWDVKDIPLNLRTYRDQIYSDDIFDKRLPEQGKNAPMHAKYGVDVTKGSILVVRPDGYVGAIVSLNEDGFAALSAYFAGFLRKA